MTIEEVCKVAASNPYLYAYWLLLEQNMGDLAVSYRKNILKRAASSKDAALKTDADIISSLTEGKFIFSAVLNQKRKAGVKVSPRKKSKVESDSDSSSDSSSSESDASMSDASSASSTDASSSSDSSSDESSSDESSSESDSSDESTSDDSDSSSEDSSSSDSDSSVAVSGSSSSSSSSSSDSSSSSESEEEEIKEPFKKPSTLAASFLKPAPKFVKASGNPSGLTAPQGERKTFDSSDDSSEADSESSDSSSSESESDSASSSGSSSDSSESESEASSSSDSSSDSSSSDSSSESESESEAEQVKAPSKKGAAALPTPVATPKVSPKHKSTGSVEPAKSIPFKRIDPSSVTYANDKVKANAYTDPNELGDFTGKSFRQEKNKKKRGSFRGGPIDQSVRSVRFDSD